MLLVAPQRNEAIAISFWDKQVHAEAYNHIAYLDVLRILSKVVEEMPIVETLRSRKFDYSRNSLPAVELRKGETLWLVWLLRNGGRLHERHSSDRSRRIDRLVDWKSGRGRGSHNRRQRGTHYRRDLRDHRGTLNRGGGSSVMMMSNGSGDKKTN